MKRKVHNVVTMDRKSLVEDIEDTRVYAMVCRGCGTELEVVVGASAEEIEEILHKHIWSIPHDIFWAA